MAVKKITDRLGPDFYAEPTFACDNSRAVEKYQMARHKPLRFDRDIMDRNDRFLPATDVYSLSAPCVNFSMAGNLSGDDAGLIIRGLATVEKTKPKTVIFENSPLLMTKKFKHVLAKIVAKLKKAGYYVDCRVLNTISWGIPQSRKRR